MPTRSSLHRMTTLAPYVLTALVIAGVWLWHLQFIGIGMISHYDEFYTFDRSTGFARMGDWFAVYSDSRPTLKKPPLQYWMSALFFEMGLRDAVALRLPSMIFAALTLIGTAVLARKMLPEQPWVMPASVLLLSSSTVFWPYATSAMLDIGAAFFVVLGLIAMLDAFENPRRWPVFAFVVFLGGLQKGPVALAFLFFAVLTLAITRRFHGVKVKEMVTDRRFVFWTFIALILAFSWQLLQGLRFPDRDVLQGSTESEMINRFIPEIGQGSARTWDTVRGLILGDEPWLRLIGFLGLLLLPFTSGRRILLGFTGIGIVFLLVMWLASGAVYARYIFVVLPLLAISAAGLFATALRSDLAGAVASVALCAVIGGPFATRGELNLEEMTRNGAPITDILIPVGENLRPGESLAVCAFKDRALRFPPGAISVYAAGTNRYARITSTELTENLESFGYEGGPLRGVCAPAHLALIETQLTDLQTSPLPGGYLEFTASGIQSPE